MSELRGNGAVGSDGNGFFRWAGLTRGCSQ